MVLSPPKLPKPIHPLDRIAFAGPMCSGKTTLAKVLVEDFGYTKTNFARILKDTAENLYGPMTKDNQSRKILQEMSADLKKWDKELFITHILLDIEDYINANHQTIVVDDLRYKREFEVLKDNGFIIIGVGCREDERLRRIYSLYPDTEVERFSHPSETEWRDMRMDYWIDNTGPGGETSVHSLIVGSIGKC
jgi:uridine kinase